MGFRCASKQVLLSLDRARVAVSLFLVFLLGLPAAYGSFIFSVQSVSPKMLKFSFKIWLTVLFNTVSKHLSIANIYTGSLHISVTVPYKNACMVFLQHLQG